MSIPLATLEGIEMQTARRPRHLRRRIPTGHALYGIDNPFGGDDLTPLGGWLTSLKKGVGSAARSTVKTLRPVVGVAAEVARGTAKIVNPISPAAVPALPPVSKMVPALSNLIPSSSTLVSGANALIGQNVGNPATGLQYPAPEKPRLASWAIPAGIGVAVLVAVMALKSER